jgi:hypothetical protein
MKSWQFNVLFCVGVGGVVFLLVAPLFGINYSQNPTAIASLGAILTYVLTQRKALTKKDSEETKESDT